jgi:hypothetical protein
LRSAVSDTVAQRNHVPHTGVGGYAMVAVHPEYVVDENQNRKAVILPFAEWERIVEDLEELDDIRAYDKAKAGSQDTVSFEHAVGEIREAYDS